MERTADFGRQETVLWEAEGRECCEEGAACSSRVSAGLRLAVGSGGSELISSGELIWMAASGHCILVCIRRESALTRTAGELYALLVFSQ